MPVSNQLKRAILRSEETHYAIGKATGVDPRTLDRLMNTDGYEIRGGTFDALCEYFGLELRAKKQSTTRKRPAKKRTAAKKRAR